MNMPVWFTVPGPCDPEDLIDGIIFAATYLGCTHLLSERTPTKSARMQQAQEAMSRVRVRANNSLLIIAEEVRDIMWLCLKSLLNSLTVLSVSCVIETEFFTPE